MKKSFNPVMVIFLVLATITSLCLADPVVRDVKQDVNRDRYLTDLLLAHIRRLELALRGRHGNTLANLGLTAKSGNVLGEDADEAGPALPMLKSEAAAAEAEVDDYPLWEMNAEATSHDLLPLSLADRLDRLRKMRMNLRKRNYNLDHLARMNFRRSFRASSALNNRHILGGLKRK